MTNQLSVYNNIADPVLAIKELSQTFYMSGMFGCANEDQGRVLAMICISEGKSPSEILKHNHIVNGRLSRRADSMLAEFKSRGGKYRILETSATRAAATFTYDGNEITEEFTIDDAKKEGLTKPDKNGESQYVKRPKAMLWARLTSKAL